MLPEPDFLAANQRVQTSLKALEVRVHDLEGRVREAKELLTQQELLLQQFIAYCQFEKRIEKVLLWLQRNGLKRLPTFSQIADSSHAIQKQLSQFDQFQQECSEQSGQVEELVAMAAEVEAEITGFRSDLQKKAESLGTVWGKFLQRVENRGDILTMALAFYSSIEQVHGHACIHACILYIRTCACMCTCMYMQELVALTFSETKIVKTNHNGDTFQPSTAHYVGVN